MDKKTYIKRFMLWTGLALAVAMLIYHIITFKVIEANAFEEAAKRVLMSVGILIGYELFAAFGFGPLIYHRKYDIGKK